MNRYLMAFKKIFSETFNLPETTIVDALVLSEIPAWDSLAHMMLIVRLEETYGFQFSGDEIADLQSVGDVRQALKAHGVNI